QGGQIGAYWYAVGIRLMNPVTGVQDIFVVATTAKEAYFDVRTADAKRFLAIHGVPDGFARIFLGPDSGQSAGILQANVQGAKRQNSGHALIDSPIDLGVATVEIFMAVRTACVVRIGAAGHAELVRVVAADVLHGDAIFQCLAAIAALDVIDTAYVGGQTEKPGAKLVAGELVGGR